MKQQTGDIDSLTIETDIPPLGGTQHPVTARDVIDVTSGKGTEDQRQRVTAALEDKDSDLNKSHERTAEWAKRLPSAGNGDYSALERLRGDPDYDNKDRGR
jgi:hypothetical protein